ncbi:hypothetical protein BD309DRAFT_864105 [Dichomitus squalens]|uniref:Uncharacterized protein n=1 Tax=Dichomitus squalens TaxID=114155 RepID=A0A4V2K498_9APHY|nr:hypothetical protein BD309DRAFT_864105 [Dichomitus squalens]TBU58594.1 hypothetical protein BD310DRAFT_819203 [Dichomitus squalens]
MIASALEWYGRSSFSPRLLGEWRAVFLYILLSLGTEFAVWRVPRLVGAVVAISVGFCLGPLFPITMNNAGRILAPKFISGSVSWMASSCSTSEGGVSIRHRGNLG